MSNVTEQASRPLTSKVLSGLSADARRALHRLARPNGAASVAMFVATYAAVVAAAWLVEWAAAAWLYPFAVAFIAARQHSLYLLNHDASHGALFTSKRANKIVATWLANLPFLHHPSTWSFVQWRRAHQLHHSKLMTLGDPYYVDRVKNGDARIPMTPRGLLWRCLTITVISPFSWFAWAGGVRAYIPPHSAAIDHEMSHIAALFRPYAADPEMRDEFLLRWSFNVALCVLLTLVGGWWLFLLYWVIPMYTVFPAILELAELTEHRHYAGDKDLIRNTYSTVPGLFTGLFISELNRGVHREHHLVARVPCYRLPALHRLLVREAIVPPAIRGLWANIRSMPSGRVASSGANSD